MRLLLVLVPLAACSQPPAPASKLAPTRDVLPSSTEPAPEPAATTVDGLRENEPTTFNTNSAGSSSAKGDPFVHALTADALRDFAIPRGTQDALVIGCIRILPDGTVAETKIQNPSGDAVLDAAVETSLAAVKVRRNATPRPVPEHLTEQLTTRWLCFRFKATT